MKKEKLSFDKFEALSENAEGQLVSGFSSAFEGFGLMMGGETNNGVCVPNTNCAGGNCVAGCSGGGSSDKG